MKKTTILILISAIVLSVAAVLVWFFVFPLFEKNVEQPSKYYTDGSIDDAEGIDVSHHNGKIDWQTVAAEYPQIQFVYVKASEGANYKDPDFKANINGAREAGYKVGAYHYFRMTSNVNKQFITFTKLLDKNRTTLIPMVDVETSDGKPVKEFQDSLRKFLVLLERKYGTRPMIYGTNRSYNELCGTAFDGQYLLYIGRYGKNAPVVKGRSHYTIWQYSEQGKLNGIPKPTDLCRFHPGCSLKDIIASRKKD